MSELQDRVNELQKTVNDLKDIFQKVIKKSNNPDTIGKIKQTDLSLTQKMDGLHILSLNFKGPSDQSLMLIMLLFELIEQQMKEICTFITELQK